MGRIIIPGRAEPEPEAEVHEISRDQLDRLVRAAIAANRTVRRDLKSQEALDRVVEVLHEEGEVVLAAAVLQLMAARVVGVEVLALQVLMQLTVDIGQEGGLIRGCRACGCTEQHACPGGCEWVEFDLCSACDRKLRAAARAAYRDSTRPGPGRDGH